MATWANTIEGFLTITRDARDKLLRLLRVPRTANTTVSSAVKYETDMRAMTMNRRARRAVKAWDRSPTKRAGAVNDVTRRPPGTEWLFASK